MGHASYSPSSSITSRQSPPSLSPLSFCWLVFVACSGIRFRDPRPGQMSLHAPPVPLIESPTSRPATTFPLLDLPIELREMIYREVIPTTVRLEKWYCLHRSKNARPIQLFQLLGVCAQVRSEIHNLLRILRPLFIVHMFDVSPFLDLLGPRVELLKRLRIAGITVSGRRYPEEDHDAIRALRERRLNRHVEELQVELWLMWFRPCYPARDSSGVPAMRDLDILQALCALGCFQKVGVVWLHETEAPRTKVRLWANIRSAIEDFICRELSSSRVLKLD